MNKLTMEVFGNKVELKQKKVKIKEYDETYDIMTTIQVTDNEGQNLTITKYGKSEWKELDYLQYLQAVSNISCIIPYDLYIKECSDKINIDGKPHYGYLSNGFPIGDDLVLVYYKKY